VFVPFVAAYAAGVTPNPDVECNRRIKFDRLLNFARAQGADALVTGFTPPLLSQRRRTLRAHAAGGRRAGVPLGGSGRVERSVLLSLSSQLARPSLRFVPPGGAFENPNPRHRPQRGAARLGEARQRGDLLRRQAQLRALHLCPPLTPPPLTAAAEYIPPRQGDFVDEEGRVVGRHGGAHLFTIGQRARISGLAQP
jgi:tRNA-uridine 2-sulfurtransferase